jgi:hypothetical protein
MEPDMRTGEAQTSLRKRIKSEFSKVLILGATLGATSTSYYDKVT